MWKTQFYVFTFNDEWGDVYNDVRAEVNKSSRSLPFTLFSISYL